MIKFFATLQWKSFWRSASMTSGVFMKLIMGFWGVLLIIMATASGFGAFKIIKEYFEMDPLHIINRFLIYWWVFDLTIRYALQKMPVINIKPLLILPFNKRKIVSFAFGKTLFSFFNIFHGFFFVPFSIVLIKNGYSPVYVLSWNLGLIALIYANNFLNILLNKKDNLIFIVAGIVIVFGGLQYLGYFDITQYTAPFFEGFYNTWFLSLVPLLLLVVLTVLSFKLFTKNLYLDAGLDSKAKNGKIENLDWLDRFGKVAIFLKNDIKLIKRNKRARSTVMVSILFLFYGLFFFNGSSVYEGPVWRIFAGICITGGFLLTFGQLVPSWDSSYYSLMMSQNIKYKEYLSSKWWLMVIATLLSTILASGYLYFGWEVYMAILVAAIYNIGFNSHVVLWAGAYVKSPIDLNSNKGVFGNKQAFNIKTLMLSLPKMALPMLIYAIGHYAYGPNAGYALVALAGIAGFAFKDIVFDKVEKIYKTEKYKTIQAYKQKN